jgi:hypothetical protein
MSNSKKNIAATLLLASIAVTAAYNWLFYNRLYAGLNLVLMFLSFFIFIQVLKFATYNKFLFTRKELLFIPILFASIVPTVNTNTLTNIAAYFLTFTGLFTLSLFIFWEEKLKNLGLLNALRLYMLHFFAQWIELPNFLIVIFSSKNTSTPSNGNLLKVLIGLIISIPFLCFFGVLFASADSLFNSIFSNINFSITQDFSSLIGSIIAFIFIFIVVVFNSIGFLFGKERKGNNIYTKQLGFIDSVISITFLGLITLLFTCFVVTQFIYMFGGDSVVRSLGIVYSDYARRGFFEMVVIVSLSILLIKFFNSFTKFTNKSTAIFLKVLMIINTLFNFVILISALSRINLYISGYGLSIDRFFVIVAIVFFALILGFILIALISDVVRIINGVDLNRSFLSYLTLVVFVLSLITVSITGFIRPDSLIAKYNINKYLNSSVQKIYDREQRDNFDPYYLTSLSSDGYLELVHNDMIFNKLDNPVKCEIAQQYSLYDKYHHSSLQSFNISFLGNSLQAESKLKEYMYSESEGKYSQKCQYTYDSYLDY